MPHKFFYIICRDGQIFEYPFEEGTFKAAFSAMVDRGVFAKVNEGTILQGVDISKVLNAEQYENYISSVQPKFFVRAGVWYDTKEKGQVRVEKWKQQELSGIKKIDAAPEPQPTDEEREAMSKKMRDFRISRPDLFPPNQYKD